MTEQGPVITEVQKLLVDAIAGVKVGLYQSDTGLVFVSRDFVNDEIIEAKPFSNDDRAKAHSYWWDQVKKLQEADPAATEVA